jgi:hypothetical protein
MNLIGLKLTRDSVFLWLGIIGGIVLYLGNLPPPIQWTWAQWMSTLGAAISIIAAKLQTSPLVGDKK